MATGKPTKMKPCKICNKLFLPSTPSTKICSEVHYQECPICKAKVVWNSTREVEPCSKECKKEATKRRNLLKYGCEHPMQNKEVREHHKQSMLDRYGVESPLQSEEIKARAISTNQSKFGSDWALSNQTVKEKAQDTMLEKYGARTTLESAQLKSKVMQTNLSKFGADNAMKNEEVKNRVISAMIDKYGVDNAMKLDSSKDKVRLSRQAKRDDIVAKARETFLSNYGVDNPSKSTEVIKKIQHTMMSRYGYKNAFLVPEFKESIVATNLESYGVPDYCMTAECRSSNGATISKLNQRFSDRLTELNIIHSMEKSIDNKSFDIVIEDRKVVIELNPTYTHNAIGNHWDKYGLPSDYHLDKTKLAQQHGYRCIHIFDWDDEDKVINLVRPTQSLHARDMKLYKLKLEVANKFLNENHLQGSCRGQLLCLGLVKDGVLYQVMTFGQSRYDKSHKVELLRLCTLQGYRVRGGSTKLFKFATEDYGLNNIISYCDRSKFSGRVYEEMNMKLIRETPPQEIWSRGRDKITANLLRQRGYDQLFGTNFGKGTSNEELMLNSGWLPVYDCGQLVFEY